MTKKCILIDGTPAYEIGMLVRMKGLRSTCEVIPLHERATCRKCGEKKHMREFGQRLKLNATGYFGVCDSCFGREL